MKTALVMHALCVSLLSGCGPADEKKSPAPLAAAGHSETPDTSQKPYYYGLIEELRTILAEDPNNLAVIIALGNAYFDNGNWKKAIMMYEHALMIDPNDADVHGDMGTCYRNIGMPGRALAEYRKALAVDPLHQNARYNMGIVFSQDKKDYAAAVRAWEELLHIAPHHPKADYMRSGIASFKKASRKGAK